MKRKGEWGRGVKGKTPELLDQYFTKPDVARRCVSFLKGLVDFGVLDFILEPCFGEGAFVEALEEEVSKDVLHFIDIDAKDKTHRMDFLKDFKPPAESKAILTVGNPPFGRQSRKAVAFFQRASGFSKVIAFIVPRTFRKYSIQSKLSPHFFFAGEEEVPPKSFIYLGKDFGVLSVFQVWVHGEFVDRMKVPFPIPENKIRVIPAPVRKTDDFCFVKRSQDPDFTIQKLGLFSGRIITEDVSSRSENSYLFIKVFDRDKVKEVLERFLSLGLETTPIKYQTVACPSISQNELCILYNGGKF